MQLTVHGPHTPAPAVLDGPGPRRLLLTAAQLQLLTASVSRTLPPMLEQWVIATYPTADGVVGALAPDTVRDSSRAAGSPTGTSSATSSGSVVGEWSALVAAGIARPAVGGGFEAVPAVAVTMLTLTGSPFAIQLAAGNTAGKVACWWAFDGVRGAGCLVRPGGRVELSAFPSGRWRSEVTRAVPAAHALAAVGRTGQIVDGLTGDAVPGPPPAPEPARVAMAVLTALAHPAQDASPAGQGALRAVDASVLRALRSPVGRLQADVFTRTEGGSATGSVAWVATAGGWLALRPVAGTARAGEPMVDLVPVGTGDLAAELAPLVAAGAVRLAQQQPQTSRPGAPMHPTPYPTPHPAPADPAAADQDDHPAPTGQTPGGDPGAPS